MKRVIFIGILLLCLTNIATGIHLRKRNQGDVNSEEKEPKPTKPSKALTDQEKIEELKKITDYSLFVKTLQGYLKTGDKFNESFRKELEKAIQKDGIKLTFSCNDCSENLNNSEIHLIPIKVSKLRPTQNEIGLENSLNWAITSKNADEYFSPNPVIIGFPILTYKKQFVLDGHHRWSQLYMMNPKAKIIAYNIEPIKDDLGKDEEPESVLRRIQATIGAYFGMIPSSAGKATNVYGDFQRVKDYLEDKIIKGNNVKDDKKVLESFIQSMKRHQGWKETDIQKLREKLYNYLLNNILNFANNVKPICNAPDREVMPQTDGGDIKKDIKDKKNLDDENKILPEVLTNLAKKSLKMDNKTN